MKAKTNKLFGILKSGPNCGASSSAITKGFWNKIRTDFVSVRKSFATAKYPLAKDLSSVEAVGIV